VRTQRLACAADVRGAGANASAEEGGEALEDGARTVNNVVHSFRLQPTQFDKKSYLSHLKGYMKEVKTALAAKNPDSVAAFEAGAQTFAKKIVGNFKDYEFVSVPGPVHACGAVL
jgi:hypothetical protein